MKKLFVALALGLGTLWSAGALADASSKSVEGYRCVAEYGPESGGQAAFCHVRSADRCEDSVDCRLLSRRMRCMADRFTPQHSRSNCPNAVREANCHTIGCAWVSTYR